MHLDRDYTPVKGRCPEQDDVCPFLLNMQELRLLELEGPLEKYYDAYCIEDALTEPDAIFHGLKRAEYDASGYCYSKRLSERYIVTGGEPLLVPVTTDEVFLVFVKQDRGYVVIDWEFRDEHPDDYGHPFDWKENFDRRVWS